MAESRSESNLSDGMAIVASLRARVLGMHLLTIDADVTVSPTPPRLTVRRPQELDRRGSSERALPRSNGSIGGGLDAAARSLEATASELTAARRGMP